MGRAKGLISTVFKGKRILNIFDATDGEEKELAFEVFDSFGPELLGYLSRRAQPDDIADLLSQVRLDFFEKLPLLRDKEQVKAYLYQICRDALRRYWRRIGRFTDGDPDKYLASNDVEEEILHAERMLVLRQCIDSITDEKTRQVATLRFKKGKSHEEIQRESGLTTDQVKKSIRRAKICISDCVTRKLGLR